MTDIVRVIRILEYVGPREWVETTLRNGFIPMNGSKQVGPNSRQISSVTLGDFPEILEQYQEDANWVPIGHPDDGLVEVEPTDPELDAFRQRNPQWFRHPNL